MTGLLIPPRQQGFSCCLLSDHLLFPSLKASRAYNLVFFSSLSLDFVVLQQHCLRCQNLTPVHRATRGINGLTSFKLNWGKRPLRRLHAEWWTRPLYTEKSHSNPVLSLDDWFLTKCGIVEKWVGGVLAAGARDSCSPSPVAGFDVLASMRTASSVLPPQLSLSQDSVTEIWVCWVSFGTIWSCWLSLWLLVPQQYT